MVIGMLLFLSVKGRVLEKFLFVSKYVNVVQFCVRERVRDCGRGRDGDCGTVL